MDSKLKSPIEDKEYAAWRKQQFEIYCHQFLGQDTIFTAFNNAADAATLRAYETMVPKSDVKELVDALEFVRNQSLFFDVADEALIDWAGVHKANQVRLQIDMQLKMRQALTKFKTKHGEME